jgi:hypothetical protein
MYAAYESGRSDKNPAEGWYKGELWFFDNYVIPLAKKLEECNVFGVSSDGTFQVLFSLSLIMNLGTNWI